MTDELVVLLDEAGQPIGSAPKATVHTRTTPLHLAFSCWVVDRAGRTLLTRRAVTKLTWPGFWTNTCCGHPAPGEAVDEAVRRRVRQELGLELADLQLALPDFRYRAVMADGTVEHEVCPVHVARAIGEPRPDPAEVADLRWATLAEVEQLVATTPAAMSPWLVLQLPQLITWLGR